ncbi:enoyl-[acyl-carrier-protein] reductase, mitochondrial-like isoform X1 [Anticarsia gemmatalis]|uniref:enoyl-[acyl-carrier-protein] reductase, mitochondrial-like isoform X1 n=1 Tax=Anticarsia gemmatalis TaxID=129554 RepID=UPI003F767A44
MALAANTKQIAVAKNLVNLLCPVRGLTSKQLTFNEFGDPLKVVEITEKNVPCLRNRDVLVRMIAAPINPADMNTIQGKYPIKPELPAVPGNEGVGIVEEVGIAVKKVCVGDKVIIVQNAQGTWRDLAVFDENVLKCVPPQLGIAECATLAVNPCTAYRMLHDFKPVRVTGSVVIQNGANSAVGQNVIQLCNAWGIQTINIVRNRTEINDLKRYLFCIGATFVLTEEELKATDIFKHQLIERPALGLNCVGGNNALGILRQMQHSGIMVTYGGMSKKPVIIPTGNHIFKNFSSVGFWMTAWNKQADENAKANMFSEIICLMCSDMLRAPIHAFVKLDDYKEGLKNTLTSKGFSGCKYILDFCCD